jgi:polar amino acid transport system substrate-binding protein
MAIIIERRQFLTGLGSAVGVAATAGLPRRVRAAGVTLKEIKESGKLRIGVEATFVPFTYRKEGKIIGYDVDVAEIFCQDLGVKPDIVDTAWAGVIASLYAKRFDMIMSMTYTAARMERVAFTIPYWEASQGMLIRASDASAYRSPEDLSGKVVATKLGAPSEIVAKKLNDRVKTAKGTGFGEIKAFTDDPARYLALGQGKVDAVFNTLPALALVLRDQPGKFAIVKGIDAYAWSGMAARKEDEELIDFLNAEITKLKANETLYKLQEKWFGFRMTLPDKIPAV